MTGWRPAFPASRPGEPTRPPVIVIADDDRDTRELYRACFDLSGFVTAEASTGEETLRVVGRLVPDVLLTDLIFPDIDGLTIARTLKAQPATMQIRVILLTGFGVADLERRAAEAGAFRALVKPCLPDVMLREVRRALRILPQA